MEEKQKILTIDELNSELENLWTLTTDYSINTKEATRFLLQGYITEDNLDEHCQALIKSSLHYTEILTNYSVKDLEGYNDLEKNELLQEQYQERDFVTTMQDLAYNILHRMKHNQINLEQENEELKKKKLNLEQENEELKKKKLNLEQEKNQLRLEKGDFEAFTQTKDKMKDTMGNWGKGLVFGAIGFIVWQLCKKRIGFEVTISDQWTLAAVILANLPFAWTFWFAITQFIKSRDLYDKYTFKENTIKFFQSIRQQHLDANDKDHYTSILNKSIDSIVSDPVEEINRKRSKALPTEDFIRMLDAINNFRTPPKS